MLEDNSTPVGDTETASETAPSLEASAKSDEARKPQIPTLLTPRIDVAIFADDGTLKQAGEDVKADRRMRRALFETHPGGLKAATTHYNGRRTPDLVIVEAPSDEAEMFAGLNALAEQCLQTTKVIVVGKRNDIALYRDLIDFGVGEYLPLPLDAVTLLAAIGRLYRGEINQALGKVYAFFGARGGVGSSTLAHNTAWSLATKHRKDVLLIDMDLAFGTTGLDFNLTPPAGVADALAEADKFDEARLERMVARQGDHLSILAPPLAMDSDIELTGERLERLIATARKAAQITVLDLPHAWAPWVRELLLDSDEIVITAAPDLANMRNFKKVTEYLAMRRPHDATARLVLNQLGLAKRPEISPADFTKAVGCRAEMELAFDGPLYGRAANNGQMLDEMGKKIAPAIEIDAFADRLIGGETKTAPKTAKAGLARLFKRGPR